MDNYGIIEPDEDIAIQLTHGKSLKKSGNRLGYNYIIVKSFKESAKNDVVKCLYIKKLTDFGFCVIKEGTLNEMKDKDGRDIRDRLIWQKHLHETLQNKVRIPRLVGSFEENGNYYLAIEHINGQSLGHLFRKHGNKVREGLLKGNRFGRKIAGYLLQIIHLLDNLHKNGIVHRDATSANFIITPFGKAYLIDMELSYCMTTNSPFPPFQLGTHGYMSPEQLSVATPGIKEDTFAVGAIILQAWTGLNPAKLTEVSSKEIIEKIKYFVPDVQIADIISQCLSDQPHIRPELATVARTINMYISDSKKNVRRATIYGTDLPKEQIKETLQLAINTFSTPLLADPDRGWFAENMNTEVKADKSKINKSWYASFHVGAVGVLYMMNRAKRCGYDISSIEPYIQKTLDIIEQKYILPENRHQAGLHFGSDGIAACLTEAFNTDVVVKDDKYNSWIPKLLSTPGSAFDMMNGIAGQINANMICDTNYPSADIKNRLKLYVDELISKQEKDGSWIRCEDSGDKKERVTNGFALGMAGIVFTLFDFSQRYNDSAASDSAERGLFWLIRNSKRKNNVTVWNSSLGKDIHPWWRDGSPGIVLSFIKGYSIKKNPLFKEYIISALKYHPEKVFYSNLSQCNGLSGLGEVYLEAYRILGDNEWYERAGWIAQLIMRMKKEHHKHGPFWLSESEWKPLPGFMLGNAGILHFLMRYLDPEKIGLPLIAY